MKNIIIFGATFGLGKAVAELLSPDNNLILLARTIESSEIDIKGTKINCDLQDPKSIGHAFHRIDTIFSSIDVFINCVGVALEKKLEETTDEEIQTAVQTNLIGAISITREAYKRMIPYKKGHILNVISTSGIKARPLETIYCASKWGLRGFMQSLALAANPNGIRVSSIIPGGMKSEHFWKDTKDFSTYLDPKAVAVQIKNIIDSDPSLSPTELVIERM